MATVGLLAKGWRRPAGAMAVLALFAWPGAIHSQTRQPLEAKVQLSWRPGWTPADIKVEPGDTLSIRVRTIKGDDPREELVQNPTTGAMVPRGQLGPEAGGKGESLAGTLLKSAARQAIVGRLGEGQPFVVGRNFKKVMSDGGPLSLRWNVPREMAGAARGFEVAIRVEPGPGDGDGEEGNLILSNGAGTGGSSGNLNDTHSGPTNNVAEVADNGLDAEPVNAQGNVLQPEENIVAAAADPVLPGSPEEKAAELDPNRNVSAADPETSLSTAQTIILAAVLAAVLLALAAAAVGVKRWRRRRLANRTRALLSVSPSLDLGEGACRGGGRPAEGPAASLSARLEEGAGHMAGGPGDG